MHAVRGQKLTAMVVVTGGFTVQPPLSQKNDENNSIMYTCCQNVVKNVVKYATKCTISKQEFQTFSQSLLVAFGHSFVLFPPTDPPPNETPGYGPVGSRG